MNKMVLVLVVVAGCVDTSPWDVPGAELKPLAADESMTWWPDIVREAADVWNSRLEPLGCSTVFVVQDVPSLDAHEVRLLPPQTWRYDGSKFGLFTTNWIQIRQPGPIATGEGDTGKFMVGMLVHELGHAMGFEHNDDVTSVMNAYPEVGVPSEKDVRDAAELVGCD